MINLMPHNNIPYKKVKKSMESIKHTIYVSGVGTGKAFIAFKIIEDLYKDKKVLYVVPQKSISNQLKKYDDFKVVKNNITFINWQQFNSKSKTKEIISNYDLVIADEAHHLYSEMYGNNLLNAIIETNKDFLGLTATPIRADNRDIRNEFADVVEGISNFDAIRLGLMPPFTYRIGVKDKDLVKYRERIIDENDNDNANNNKAILDFSECEEVLREINIKYPRNKYIVFYNDIASLEKNKEMIKRTFPNKKIMELHSKKSLKEQEDIQNAFNDLDNAVLLTVDMALEGVHIKNVDGIVLMRNVGSIPTFEQMLGRVCDIGSQISPVVIDFSRKGSEILTKLINANTLDREDSKYLNLEAIYNEIQKFMNKDINEQDISIKEENITFTSEFNKRDILHIGLGSHEEWDSIDDFLKEWNNSAPLSYNKVRQDRINKAVISYNNTLNSYPTMKEEDRNKLKLHIAKICSLTVDEINNGINKYNNVNSNKIVNEKSKFTNKNTNIIER